MLRRAWDYRPDIKAWIAAIEALPQQRGLHRCTSLVNALRWSDSFKMPQLFAAASGAYNPGDRANTYRKPNHADGSYRHKSPESIEEVRAMGFEVDDGTDPDSPFFGDF